MLHSHNDSKNLNEDLWSQAPVRNTQDSSPPLSPARHRLPSDNLIDSSLHEAWCSIRKSSSHCISPYFSPHFCEALLRSGVKVEFAIQKNAGEIVGVLPFQRRNSTYGLPAGGGLNDAHGPLISEGHQFDWTKQLAEAKLSAYEVHACPDSHPLFASLTYQTPSYLADLRGGSDDSYEKVLAGQHRTIARQGQKDRKLSRKVGPMRIEFDCQDPRFLEKLMDWKSRQYQRTHIGDIFQLDWVRKLILNLHSMRSAPLRGLLSVLFAGDVPVAMHFGLLEGKRLHYWYPVYEPQYGYGSPGTRLFLEIARQGPERGIEMIDFGYGFQPYKEVLCNQKSLSGIGLISNSRWAHLKYHAKYRLTKSMKKIWFKERLKPIVKKLIPHRDMGRFLLPPNTARPEK